MHDCYLAQHTRHSVMPLHDTNAPVSPLRRIFFCTLKCAIALLIIQGLPYQGWSQACPTLSQNAVFSSNCSGGVSPCTVCPGDQITLETTGTGLQPGSCVNWYYGTTPNFNPYLGQGTLIGCAQIEPAPIDPCDACPTVLSIFVNACGTEQNNEMMVMWSGSGFAVNALTVDFAAVAGGDIGTACQWQEPTSTAVASIQSICTGATVVGAGPGENVPPNVPVIVFTSAGYNFNYNFGSLCPLSPVVYVLQNGCTRSTDAFPQAGGSITTTIGIGCGCNQSVTYNTAQLAGGDGSFIGVPPFPFPVLYGNIGCGFPPLPGGGGGGGNPNAIAVPPLTFSPTQDMCNNGPYWVRGVVQPLPAGCPQALTNSIMFDVVCPTPVLQPGPNLCSSSSAIPLTPLADPAFPSGTWSGPGVFGTFFDPAGQSGPIVLTFTPNSNCGTAANTTIQVYDAPVATFDPVGNVCAGQSVTLSVQLSGQPPFMFNLLAGNTPIGSYTVNDNVFTIDVTPPATTPGSTLYRITNLQDAFCTGLPAGTLVSVTPATSAVLSLASGPTVCAGQPAAFSLDFLGGQFPYEFTPILNGVPQPTVFSTDDPTVFTLNINSNSTVIVTSATASDCPVMTSGTASVSIAAAPTATMLSGTRTICEGLLDTLRIQVNSTANGLPLTCTQNGIALTTVTAQAPLTLIPVVPVVGTNLFRINALTGGACAGIISGADTTIVLAKPVANLTGGGGQCGNGPAQLTVQYTPANAPLQIQYTANGIPQAPVNAPNSPFSWPVTVVQNTTFGLSSVASNGCVGSSSGTALLAPGSAPTATLSGGGPICLFGNGDSLTVSFTGTGPWTFEYSANGVVQPPISTAQNPYKIFVNPVGFTEYALVSVANAACPGTVSGQAQVFVYAPSAVTLAGAQTFCDSAHTTLQANVSGTAPFIISYAINGVIQPTDTIDDGPLVIPVDVSQTSIFSMVSIQSPGCIGDAIGSATITILSTPTVTNITRTCNAATSNYVLSFQVVNGTPPYTLVSGAGTFSGNTFTSAPISQLSPYNIVFRDANDCNDVVVSGPSTCNCTTQAGTITTTSVAVCVGEVATATHTNNQVLDNSDVLRYILYTNPAQPTTSILAWSSSPSFAYNATLVPGQTYYMAAIAGNTDAAGLVSLTDPCLQLSAGIPVLWRALPDVDFMSDTLIACIGDSVNLTLNLGGNAPFLVQYTLDGLAQPSFGPIASSGPWTLKWDPAPGQQILQITGVADQFCANAGVADTLVVVEPLGVQVINLQRNCQAATLTYMLEFDVSGQAPYSVTGITGTWTSATHYVSAPIASGVPFTVIVNDATGCSPDTLKGVADCTCVTNAGTMSSAQQVFCSGEPAMVADATGLLIPIGSGLNYLLTTAPAGPGWTILAQSTAPNFNFNATTMTEGTTYYVVAVAGAQLPGGVVDLNDICVDYSNATPIQWRFGIAAAISGGGTVCPGGGATFSVLLSGGGPYSFVLSRNGVTQPAQTTTVSPFTFVVPINETTSYTLLSVASGGCSGTVFGTATATITTPPQATQVDVQCDPDNLNYVLSFRISNGVAPNPAYVVTGVVGTLTDTTFTSVQIPIGTPYSVTITTPNGCSSTFAGAGTCVCLTDAGTLIQPQNACTTDSVSASIGMSPTLDQNDTLLYVLCTDPAILPLGVVASRPDAPVFGFTSNMVAGQTYYIVGLAGNALTSGLIDQTDPCVSATAPVAVRFTAPPSATFMMTDTLVCPGSPVSFDVLAAGASPYTIQYSLNGSLLPPASFSSPAFGINSISVNESLTYAFLAITDANNCTMLLGDTVQIGLKPQPIIQLVGGGTVCPNTPVTLHIEYENTNLPDVTWQSSAGDLVTLNDVVDGYELVVTPDMTTTYFIASSTLNQNECPPTLSGIVTVNVAPIVLTVDISDFNGYNTSCSGTTDGFVTVDATGGTGMYTYQWDNGATTTNQNGLSAGTYTVTVTDPTGCTADTTLNVTTPPAITAQITAQPPRCFEENNGSITLLAVNGGASPLRWRVGNGPSRVVDMLPDVEMGLRSALYDVVITDANDCAFDTIIEIITPASVLVDLGPDRVIALGDSTLILAQTTANPPASIVWTPRELVLQPTQLSTWTAPLRTTLYSLTVTDTAGCTAMDELVIQVRDETRIFVPNGIDPQSTDNQILTVYAGNEVERVEWLRVYDRWGDLVFENTGFAPNDPSQGWDGRINRQATVPAVFVWAASIRMVDGSVRLLKGDVTVVR
jgi:SprB repeat